MADASYIVEIASQMTGGAQTSAQLDTVTAKLLSVGATSDTVHDAIAKLSNQLDTVAAASSAAASALAAGQSEYAKLERAALQAAKAEEKASLSGVVSPEVSASAAAAASAVNAYAEHLKTLEAEADKTAAAQKTLESTLSNAKQINTAAAGALEQHAVSLRMVSRGLGELGGPLGDTARKVLAPVRGFQVLSEQLGSSNAIMAVAALGAAALVVAVIAVGVAAAAATVKIAAWAIGLANTNRELQLTDEAAEALDPTLAKLHSTTTALEAQTGLTAAAIDKITQSLEDAHVKASAMPAALQAAALAESALGSGGAQEFVKRMQASKQSVTAFSATVTAQLGGVVSKKLLGLDEQATQFHKNIAALFGGLNIDGALTGLQKLVGLFDANSESGKALKFLFSAIFQPLIDNADSAATVLEAFALGFEIGMVKLYIALKPTIKAISEFFGQHDPSLGDTLAVVTKAGEYMVPVFEVVVGVFGALAVVIGASIAVAVAMQVAVYALIYAVIYAGAQIVGVFMSAWQRVITFFSGLSLSTIGGDLIQGLVNGLIGAGPAVVGAIGHVITGAITSAKNLLGIHSPSTVFAEIGDNTVAGFSGGVDDAAPDAQNALANMVDPSAASASAKPTRAADSGGSSDKGAGAQVTGNTFIFNGVQGAEDAESRFGELITRFFEGQAISVGAMPT